MTVASAGRLQRSRGSWAAEYAGDALTVVGMAFAIPFIILLAGAPIVLLVQLGLWIARQL